MIAVPRLARRGLLLTTVRICRRRRRATTSAGPQRYVHRGHDPIGIAPRALHQMGTARRFEIDGWRQSETSGEPRLSIVTVAVRRRSIGILRRVIWIAPLVFERAALPGEKVCAPVAFLGGDSHEPGVALR